MTDLVSIKRKKKPSLTEDDLYGDQIRFFTQSEMDGREVQRQLGKAQVAIFGAGAVGSHTSAALASSGVGALRIIDDARVTKPDLTGNRFLDIQDLERGRAEALVLHLNQTKNSDLKCENVSADIESDDELQNVVKGMDCVLVCMDSPAPALFDRINQICLKTQVRWIAGQIYRGLGIVGPTIIPFESPCFKCYELRRNANLVNYEEIEQYETRLRQLKAIKNPSLAPKPLAVCMGGLLALEAIRLIVGQAFPQTIGRILRIDFFAPEMTYHRILRLPNCPACGARSGRAT